MSKFRKKLTITFLVFGPTRKCDAGCRTKSPFPYGGGGGGGGKSVLLRETSVLSSVLLSVGYLQTMCLI